MFENGKIGPLKQRFPIYCCKIDAPTRAINLIPILGAGEQSTNNERGTASSSSIVNLNFKLIENTQNLELYYLLCVKLKINCKKR